MKFLSEEEFEWLGKLTLHQPGRTFGLITGSVDLADLIAEIRMWRETARRLVGAVADKALTDAPDRATFCTGCALRKGHEPNCPWRPVLEFVQGEK